jgi:hypothetical protein
MSSGLYPRLLGDSWANLGDAVRRFHDSGATVHAVGVFQVRHGGSWLARALAWFARLPAAGDAVAVRLQVTAGAGGEEWRRTFAGRPLVSGQFGRPDGLLAERVGITELRFRLAVAGESLTYQTVCAAVGVGSWRVPLPRWLGPRVQASERPSGNPGRIDVSVEVGFPWLGRLIAYAGLLTQVEAPE